MINEFKQLLDGLESLEEVDISQTHKSLTKAGKSEAVRVILDKDTDEKIYIKKLEYMTKDDMDAIWVLGDGNKNHFPDIKLIRPLRPHGNLFYAELLNDKIQETNCPTDMSQTDFELIINKSTDNLTRYQTIIKNFKKSETVNFNGIFPGDGYRKKIQERYELLSLSENNKVQEVSELFDNFLNYDLDGHVFLADLEDKITENLISKSVDENLAKLFMTILYGNKIIKETGDLQDSASDRIKIVIDYQPDKDVDIFASNAKYYKNAINQQLFKAESNQQQPTSDKQSELICPIYGKTLSLVDNTFPKIKTTTALGNVTPYSRFDDGGKKTTVHRYHKSGINAFTVDKVFAEKLDSLLNFLTGNDNKFKTWKHISAESSTTPDVLIAFCHETVTFPIIKFLGKDELNVEDLDEYRFIAQELINLLKGKSVNPHALADFIIIRKVDTANQKVIYSQRKTLAQLQKSAETWCQATENLPMITLAIFGKDNKVSFTKPWSIAPDQLIHLSKQSYEMDGSLVKGDIPAISFAQTMRLFLNEGNQLQTLALQVLQKITNQTQWLFELSVNQKQLATHAKSSKNNSGVFKENRNTLMYATILGILLYKLNRFKENYMSDLSYQLGQLCSAMNELHLGYCEDVRNGSLPTKLLGSSAYSIAVKSPNRALEYLASRIAPYESWVEQQNFLKDETGNYKKSSINNAIHANRWIKNHAKDLYQSFSSQTALPKTHTAELMLGYLAGREIVSKLATN